MTKENTKTLSRQITRSVALMILGLMLIAFAWTIYEVIVCGWRPYWATIASFCLGYIAGWLVADRRQLGKGMMFSLRITQARSLVIAVLILVAFAWRIYELMVARRPYWGTIATFSLAFVVGWLIVTHAQWEKGMTMSPRLKKMLSPILYGIAYTSAFIYLAVSSVMILGVVVWIYGGIVSYWKAIVWCIGGITLWLIAGWFATRKDRMRTRA